MVLLFQLTVENFHCDMYVERIFKFIDNVKIDIELIISCLRIDTGSYSFLETALRLIWSFLTLNTDSVEMILPVEFVFKLGYSIMRLQHIRSDDSSRHQLIALLVSFLDCFFNSMMFRRLLQSIPNNSDHVEELKAIASKIKIDIKG